MVSRGTVCLPRGIKLVMEGTNKQIMLINNINCTHNAPDMPNVLQILLIASGLNRKLVIRVLSVWPESRIKTGSGAHTRDHVSDVMVN